MHSMVEDRWSGWAILIGELTLQLLALEGGVSEALAEEVLTLFSASMTTVAGNWDDHLMVSFVSRQNHLLETW